MKKWEFKGWSAQLKKKWGRDYKNIFSLIIFDLNFFTVNISNDVPKFNWVLIAVEIANSMTEAHPNITYFTIYVAGPTVEAKDSRDF